jgi:hypothetical protein
MDSVERAKGHVFLEEQRGIKGGNGIRKTFLEKKSWNPRQGETWVRKFSSRS